MGISELWTASRSAIVTGVACVALCLPIGYCKGYDAARDRYEAERAAANVAALKTARKADDVATAQRVVDAQQNAANEGKLIDAIQSVPDAMPDPVRVQLGCQRLRASGTSAADFPAVCGPSGAQ